MKYVVVFENAGDNYSAYVPDLPGCAAVGDTPDEVEREIQEAIAFHLDGMREENLVIPAPSSWAKSIDVQMAASASSKQSA